MRGTFEALVGSLVVLNTVVAADWHLIVFDPVYQLMWETFMNDLRIGLAYHVVAEVVEWARNRDRVPLRTFSMLLVVVTCVYVLHYTSLHFVSYVSSRAGRTSISTINYQHVRTARRLVAYCKSNNK